MKTILLILLFLIFSSPVFADDKMVLGLEVYIIIKHSVVSVMSCKQLRSTGTIGPNLDQIKPQIPQIIAAVTYGIGVMQAWEGILTQEEIEAVVLLRL